MTARNAKILQILAAFCLPLALQSCAPKAVEMEGEIAKQVREGIEHGTGSFDHSRFDAILRQYNHLEFRRFDYVSLKTHQNELEDYLDQIAKAGLRQLSRNELLAFFINAYKAYTLKTILNTITAEEPMGVSSIRDIPDVTPLYLAAFLLMSQAGLAGSGVEFKAVDPIGRFRGD